MNRNRLLRGVLYSLVIMLWGSSQSYAAGWCGISQKVDCGDWVIQYNLFGPDDAIDGEDCVVFDGCFNSAEWTWSDLGVFTQLLVEKEGFCDVGYSVSNTEDFNVSFDGEFSNQSQGSRRMVIVSWGKVVDNCIWNDQSIFELYVHERSFEEEDRQATYDFCSYQGRSTRCSGSEYDLFDCKDIDGLIGRSLRCWRVDERLSGTTDIDCLWENWRNIGTVSDAYYYFTEVGSEVSPNSRGVFTLNSAEMVRTPIEGEVVSYVKIRSKANNLYLRPGSQSTGAAIFGSQDDGSDFFRWEQVPVPGKPGFFFLRNAATNKVFKTRTNAVNSEIVQSSETENRASAQWQAVSTGLALSVFLQNANNRRMAPVSSAVTNLQVRPSTDSSPQVSYFLEAAGTGPANNLQAVNDDYIFIRNKTTGLYLRPESDAVNTNMFLNVNNFSDWFKWVRVPIPNTSAFYLRNVKTGLHFKPVNDNVGARVVQKNPQFNTGLNAQWVEQPSGDGDGSIFIVNRGTGQKIRPRNNPTNPNSTGFGVSTDLVSAPGYFNNNAVKYFFEPVTGGNAREGQGLTEELIERIDFSAALTENSLLVQGQGLSNVTLYGLNGQIHGVSESISDTHELSVNGLEVGIYIVKALDFEGKPQVKKLVIGN